MIWKEEVKKLRSKITPKLTIILILLESQIIDSLVKADLDRSNIKDDISKRLSLQQILLERAVVRCTAAQSDASARHADLSDTLHAQRDQFIELQSKSDTAIQQGHLLTSQLIEQDVVLKAIHQNSVSTHDQLNSVSTQLTTTHHEVALIKADTRSILEFMVRMWKAATEKYTQLRSIADLITDLLKLTVNMTMEMTQTLLRLLREFGEMRRQLAHLERYLPMQLDFPTIRFRDAFNKVTPFPYHIFRQWEGARRMVAAIFIDKQGFRRVEMGHWFVTHIGKGVRIEPKFWDKAFEPGDELSMTMVLDHVKVKDGLCPYPSCGADTTSAEVIRGGKFCPQCFRYSQLSRTLSGDTQNRGVMSQGGRTGSPSGSALGLDRRKRLESFPLSPNSNLPDAPEAPESEETAFDDIDDYHNVQVVRMEPENDDSTKQCPELTIEARQDPIPIELKDEKVITLFVHWQEDGEGILKLRLPSKILVEDLKAIIHDRIGIPQFRQRLKFARKFLRNKTTLAMAGLEDQSTIRLTESRRQPLELPANGTKISALSSIRPVAAQDNPSISQLPDEDRSSGTLTRGRPSRRDPNPLVINRRRVPEYNVTRPSYIELPSRGYSGGNHYHQTVYRSYDGASILQDSQTQARDIHSDDNYVNIYQLPQPSYFRLLPPASARRTSAFQPTKLMATEADANRAGVPPGYSLKNWDPAETPILLLGSVFSADSLGKWIYEWTVYHHGSPTSPTAHLASELWLLLNKLASKLKNAEHIMPSVRNRDKQEMVEAFIESGERLWDRFRKVLKECERYMLRVAKHTNTGTLAKRQGTEFVNTIFGHDVSYTPLLKSKSTELV